MIINQISLNSFNYKFIIINTFIFLYFYNALYKFKPFSKSFFSFKSDNIVSSNTAVFLEILYISSILRVFNILDASSSDILSGNSANISSSLGNLF